MASMAGITSPIKMEPLWLQELDGVAQPVTDPPPGNLAACKIPIAGLEICIEQLKCFPVSSITGAKEVEIQTSAKFL